MNILPYIGEDEGSQAVPLASWLMGSFKSTEDDILMPPAPDMFIPGMFLLGAAAAPGAAVFFVAGAGFAPGMFMPGMAFS